MGRRLWQIALTLTCGCTSALDFSTECKRDQACASLGPDLICVAGQCVSETSMLDGSGGPRDMATNPMPDAQVSTVDGLIAQGCVLIGQSGGDARTLGVLLPPDQSGEAGVRHAISEINAAGGLDGRPLGALACPTPSEPDAAVERARRMAEIISEPALIGAPTPDVNAALYTDVARIYGLVLLTPTVAEPSRAAVDDAGLLWHLRSSARQDAAAVAHLALLSDPARVAIVHRDTEWGRSLASQAEAVLCAADRCPPDGAQSLAFAPFADDLFDQIAPAAEADVVISIGRPVDALPLFSALADAEAPRVFAVGGPRSAADLAPVFSLDAEGNSRLPAWREALRSALLCGSATVGPSRRGPAWDGWIGDFETAWPSIEAEAAAPYVDAVFSLAYAIVAAERADGEITGARIADGLGRLSAGPRVRVGRLDWTTGVAALADGDIDLEGVSSALAFDAATGVAQSGVDGTWYDGSPTGVIPAGEVLDVDGRAMPPTPPPVCGEE